MIILKEDLELETVMTEKILLDTDIGSDIDDAVCLAYLLMLPACELVGITTVTGQGLLRARLASVICQAASKKVPIFIGAEKPLIVDQRQPIAQQANRLYNWPHEGTFPEMPAVEFMAKVIFNNPGEVTLLAIGPLTNLALLFAVYPETAGALKGLVMMSGVFRDDPNNPWKEEWNVLLDPHAAEIVYNTPIEIHRSVGLDVTRQVRLPAEQVKAQFNHKVLQPVLDFASVWFAEQEELIFHDPLAAVTIFEPDVCKFTKGLVTINSDAASGPLGATKLIMDEGIKPHQVALNVNTDAFFESFFSVFK